MPTRDELLREMDRVGVDKWINDPANEKYLPSWLRPGYPERMRAQLRPYRFFDHFFSGNLPALKGDSDAGAC
ncbi:hypothetical protein LCGC14_1022140 [marine sediment metagenome]|uniref:Uncharacterized protein n=1 Tax=marine sediment metagenome TaxID=412755 RepID=A0A0F9NIP4_9ZZZZ